MIHSSFIFKENHVIEEEDEVVIVQEGLDIIDIDDNRNLVDLIKVLSIDEESGNLKVIVDGGELTRNMNRKPMNVPSVTNAINGVKINMVFLWLYVVLNKV